jgi:monofunctional biosynthetic peptidoglycan transglycosylase
MAKKTGGNKITRLLKKLFIGLMQLFVIGFQFAMLLIILYRVVPVPLTPLHVLRVYEQFKADKPLKLTKSWRSIDYVTDRFSYAVLTSEDIKFIHHYGFDFEQIKKSIERGLETGKKMRGASTITQQTAKNLFFTPKRSWIRKVPEMAVTVCLEALWTKKRILEVYINIIEMGEGVYGVEAAARHYFKKNASNLSKRECALIAACLPNPRKFIANKPTARINKKAAVIQRYMYKIGQLPWKVSEKKETKNKK